MLIIEIEPLSNGAHGNDRRDSFRTIPEGWAVVPEEMEIPETFPFVNIETEDGVVTSMTAGTVPEPEPEPEPEPTLEDRMSAMESAIERGLAL